MTTDDLDQADKSSVLSDDAPDSRQSKRFRLKDALNRTKTKLQHVKEERDLKKHLKDQAQTEHALDDDVNDFLAAGRASFASSTRPSLGPVSTPPNETSSSIHGGAPGSPRPSTSDSTAQASPRRGPPLSVPRIDVSASPRFPNAKVYDETALLSPIARPVTASEANPFLKPEYKTRARSTSSIASKERKIRIRGLSVGFADAPPVIIGEGGDEAQAPPVEISRAKARVRSASLQGRQQRADLIVDDRVSIRFHKTNDSYYEPTIPKSLARTNTGALTDSFQRTPRGPHDETFIPAPLQRTSTGFVSPDTLPLDEGPPMPTSQSNKFRSIAPIETGKFDLAKEFEMTLGLRSPIQSSPLIPTNFAQQVAPIAAPKPQRAPPSYDLLESGEHLATSNSGLQEAIQQANKPLSQSNSSKDHSNMQRRAVQIQHSNLDESVQVKPGFQNSPNPTPHPTEPPAYYPPPPQRQTTVVRRHIQQLEPIQPRSSQARSNHTVAAVSDPYEKGPLQFVTRLSESSDRATDGPRDGSAGSPARINEIATATNVQYGASQNYAQSPHSYHSSREATPKSATNPVFGSQRYYENVKQANAPERFV